MPAPAKYVESDVEGPPIHDLANVNLRWYSDGSLRVTFPKGTAPINIDVAGSGNYRRAKFTVRRRQI